MASFVANSSVKFSTVRRTSTGKYQFPSDHFDLFLTREDLTGLVRLADALDASELQESPQDEGDIAYSLPSIDEQAEAEW
ncbi:hypothetical protein [Gryllotalpicola koreensis]|uniref:Uncharacterized protein n=1 Tax=Gryllotalpicola koreensis TaxID=993086 RepID=A0ABP8A2A5_9MICO